MSEELVRSGVRLLEARSEHVQPVDTVSGVAEDREDDLVLATAITAGADGPVTGDRLLRAIDRYEGVRILAPGEFLDFRDQEPESKGGRISSAP